MLAAVSPLTSWTFDPIQLTSLALIGFLSWHQVPLLTGPKVLGRLSPGDAPLALPSPAAPPTGLLIRTA